MNRRFYFIFLMIFACHVVAAVELPGSVDSAPVQSNETTERLLEENRQLLLHEQLVDQRLQTVTQSLDDIKMDYERVKNIIDVAGQTDQVSKLLLRRRGFAVNTQYATQDLLDYRKRINEAMLRQLELNELLRDFTDTKRSKLLARELAHTESVAGSQLEKINTEQESTEQESTGQESTGQESTEQESTEQERRQDGATEYQAVLLDLSKSLSRYALKLAELEVVTIEVISISEKYQNFLDEKLLWLPSTGPIPITEYKLLLNGMLWLIQPSHIDRFIDDVVQALVRFPLLALVWIVLVSLLFAVRRKSIGQLDLLAIMTRKVRTDKYTATLLALLHTLILIVPLPLFVLGFAFLLERLPNTAIYTQTIVKGLFYAGILLLLLTAVRQLCRTQGLAEIHFRWSSVLCQVLVKQVRWLRTSLFPLGFFVGLSAGLEQNQDVVAIGRLSFIVAMLLAGMAIYQIWGRSGRYMRSFMEATTPDKDKWYAYHVVWYPLLQALPWLLIVSALLGYYYTALYFAERFVLTIAGLLLLMVLNGLLLRRFYMTQRLMRYQETVRKREEAMLLKDNPQLKPEPDSGAEQLPVDESSTDFGELSEQAQKFLRVIYLVTLFSAIWIVWKDVIPALNIFNAVELPFSKQVFVDGQSAQAALTLGDLLLGVLFAVLAVLATKNLPGLLELSLLQHLPLSASTRYAVKTLTQYLVAMIGIILACNAIGLEWSNIQWLVAALSVGLGFGLQEIVANFVSGIILLFEQPIRVGDIVTVNNVSGKVSRIRIRATTIVNWERQEYIIPNKAFITGDLTNWTLTDTLNRLLITVGIAYGSDVRRAMQLIREAADEHMQVLLDPEPRVTFEEFGDNSLLLRLRVYLNDVEIRLQTLTELHQSIYDKFNQAGIVIAFPQRDVHLDTSKPLELLLRI